MNNIQQRPTFLTNKYSTAENIIIFGHGPHGPMSHPATLIAEALSSTEWLP